MLILKNIYPNKPYKAKMKRLMSLFCTHNSCEIIREIYIRDLYKEPYDNVVSSHRFETNVIERCNECWKYIERIWYR